MAARRPWQAHASRTTYHFIKWYGVIRDTADTHLYPHDGGITGSFLRVRVQDVSAASELDSDGLFLRLASSKVWQPRMDDLNAAVGASCHHSGVRCAVLVLSLTILVHVG